mmetsp:Transcript_54136/g.90092  ORF Transcript_54136/g.90092 Transcript_54136/m.90092 type:complete len:120 (-) Transcript_54136:158-517(-)
MGNENCEGDPIESVRQIGACFPCPSCGPEIYSQFTCEGSSLFISLFMHGEDCPGTPAGSRIVRVGCNSFSQPNQPSASLNVKQNPCAGGSAIDNTDEEEEGNSEDGAEENESDADEYDE